jgi:hypothetical protein
MDVPQPLWNIKSPDNLSQIVPKGHRSSESYAGENASREKGHASVTKVVVLEIAAQSATVRACEKSLVAVAVI